MRRKAGTLLALEIDILAVALDLFRAQRPDVHGFALAQELRQRAEARRLTAHGTLYKALARLERAGFLESRWEDALAAQQANRPRRRLYRITSAGEAAFRAAVPEWPARRLASPRHRPARGGAS